MRGALIVGLVLVIWGLGSRGHEELADEDRGGDGDKDDSSPGPAPARGDGLAVTGLEAGGDADIGDNSLADYDDADTDIVPFAVWVEAGGRRCAGSLVSARGVLTAASCVSGAVPRGAVTVGTAGGRDATRAARAALSPAGGLALLELSAALPNTRPIVHAGAEGGGCGAPCLVTRGVGPARVKALPARRARHCPAALGHHPGAFCLHPVTLCQNDTGTGVTCGGKLCGVVVRSAPPEPDTGRGPDAGSCSDAHEAAALSHWKQFMRCALDDRSCHGACQSYCTEHFFNIEGTTWANDKLSKYHDVSVEGGRSTFHHVYGDRDGSRSFQHAGPGGGRPYAHTVGGASHDAHTAGGASHDAHTAGGASHDAHTAGGASHDAHTAGGASHDAHTAGGTAHYPHNAYHPPAFSDGNPQQQPYPDNPFHQRSDSSSSDMAIPETNTDMFPHLGGEMGGDHRKSGVSGGGGGAGVGGGGDEPGIQPNTYVPPIVHQQTGEIKDLDNPRPKAIPSMTHDIPWTGDYGEPTGAAGASSPPGGAPAPAPGPALPWVASAGATLGDYDMVSSAAPPVRQSLAPSPTPAPSPSPTPAPATSPPTTPPPPTKTLPPSTHPAATPCTPASTLANTTTRTSLKAAVTKPGVLSSSPSPLPPSSSPRPPSPSPRPPSPPRPPAGPPAPAPSAPPRPPRPHPPSHVSPGLNVKKMEHAIKTFRPKTTEMPFPFEPLTKTHKPHHYSNDTRRFTTEDYQRFDNDEPLQATEKDASKGTLGSHFVTALLLAVLLTL